MLLPECETHLVVLIVVVIVIIIIIIMIMIIKHTKSTKKHAKLILQLGRRGHAAPRV